MNRTKLMCLAGVLLLAPVGCGDTGDDGDGGVTVGDGGALTDAAGDASSLKLTSGMYKVTGITQAPGSDGCKIEPEMLSTMMLALNVEIDPTGLMKVGSLKGNPPAPSLGQGIVTLGGTSTLTRLNKVMVPAPSTCTYDSDVRSTVTHDGNDTFGLGVIEKQSMRTTCMVPAGVGAECMSIWSWRLVRIP